jgi:membrane-associated protein
MDSFFTFVTSNADSAHWWCFILLMLAGINIPISEDFVIIVSGFIAATALPQNTLKLFLFVFSGCYFSDAVSYSIGRIFTPWLRKKKWLQKIVENKRIDQVNEFYSKYGVLTLFFGRFIPFGVRNCLFMSAGMGKMPFGKFMLVDGIACFLSNLILFSLAYSLGEHYAPLLTYVKKANLVLFILFVLTVISIFWYKYRQKIKATQKD